MGFIRKVAFLEAFTSLCALLSCAFGNAPAAASGWCPLPGDGGHLLDLRNARKRSDSRRDLHLARHVQHPPHAHLAIPPPDQQCGMCLPLRDALRQHHLAGVGSGECSPHPAVPPPRGAGIRGAGRSAPRFPSLLPPPSFLSAVHLTCPEVDAAAPPKHNGNLAKAWPGPFLASGEVDLEDMAAVSPARPPPPPQFPRRVPGDDSIVAAIVAAVSSRPLLSPPTPRRRTGPSPGGATTAALPPCRTCPSRCSGERSWQSVWTRSQLLLLLGGGVTPAVGTSAGGSQHAQQFLQFCLDPGSITCNCGIRHRCARPFRWHAMSMLVSDAAAR